MLVFGLARSALEPTVYHTQSDLSTFMFVKTTDTNDRLNLTSSFKSIAGMIVFLGLGLGCCFQQYYSYIVAVSFFFFF